MHDHHALPIYSSHFVEGNEPPLYYLLVAPVGVDTVLPPVLEFQNGSGYTVSPYSPHKFQNTSNDFQHYWPLRVARLISAVMSVVTVLFAYLAGREASRNHLTGLLTGALVAFLPEFTFRGMNVSADALVTTLCAVEVYLIVILCRRGFTTAVGVAAAVVLAAAFLSKASAIALAPALLLTLLLIPGTLKERIRRCWLMGLTLVLVLPWLLRNKILYGDVLASSAMLKAVPGLVHKKTLTAPYFTGTFIHWMLRSFVGVFGWMNLWLDERVYRAFALLALVAACGVVIRWAQLRRDRALLFILATIPVASFIVAVDINLTFTQPQGRYLFPALPAIALLIAMGLEQLPFWSRWHSRFTSTFVTGFAAANAAILLIGVIPAYWPPPVTGVPDMVVSPRLSSHHDVALNQPFGGFRIVGPDPQLRYAVNVDASQFSFLTLDIAAAADRVLLEGAVYFQIDRQQWAANQVLRFSWLGDGTPRHVIVTLPQNPAWRGHVTALRIQPVVGDPLAYAGQTIGFTNVLLRGSLERQTLGLIREHGSAGYPAHLAGTVAKNGRLE